MQQEINNNFSKEDEFYMKRAIELAKRGTGWVNPNPLVGAVIVKDDRIIMATIMVYGMVVYNVALNTGTVNGTTFLAATHELPIMVPIAFVLEFFVVGKIAKMLAFTVMRPTDRPQFITYAISICICCIMCPVMSLVATFLFKEPSFGMWVKTWAMNFPMAICYQMFYCGPLVRLIFRAIFVRKNADATEAVTAAEAE